MEWISVKDKLPDDSERVLIPFDYGIDIAYFFKDLGWKQMDGGDWFEVLEKVTHWMPLPAPPSLQI